VGSKRACKDARVEVRVTSAELKAWRRLARVFERSVGEAVRVAVNEAAAPYRGGRHCGPMPKAARRGARTRSSGLAKGK
jgi:hypothetical protein